MSLILSQTTLNYAHIGLATRDVKSERNLTDYKDIIGYDKPWCYECS